METLSLNTNIIWVAFSFAIVAFSIISLVLIYHWRRYGTNEKVIGVMQAIYLGVGILFIAVSAVVISLI